MIKVFHKTMRQVKRENKLRNKDYDDKIMNNKQTKEKKEFGRFGESVRYCTRCKTNTTFMCIQGNHSQCLMCGNTFSKKTKEILRSK